MCQLTIHQKPFPIQNLNEEEHIYKIFSSNFFFQLKSQFFPTFFLKIKTFYNSLLRWLVQGGLWKTQPFNFDISSIRLEQTQAEWITDTKLEV